MNLAPARWIWFPSERCLHNTFILFRREIEIATPPKSMRGWLTADARYRLTVNGKRVQWGPAPCDPRYQDVDPFDLAPHLKIGTNVIGVEVCYFGEGDGTWPMGSPGFIFKASLDRGDSVEEIVSNETWKCFLDRAHPPGMYKRWYLRALQEEFDARLYEYGWDTPAYRPDARWLPAQLLPGKTDMPAIFAGGPEYVVTSESHVAHAADGFLPKGDQVGLRERDIPQMVETIVPAEKLFDEGRVQWHRDPLDWFESRVPGSLTATREDVSSLGAGQNATRVGAPATTPSSTWVVPASRQNEGIFLTFRFAEQIVGWPRFVIDAPAGTIVEMMVSEAHDETDGPAWMETGIFHWSRFICRDGRNEFEAFDFESLRWIQLHIRQASAPATVSDVGCRRRVYPWPEVAKISCGEPALQRLFDASINTLNNCAQESIVDGMGRERQQYSGDCGHQLQAIRYAFKETRLPARFLKTFSQGITLDGYFLDCWPAYDRLCRIMQRQMGTTVWGPLLDHGIGFNFDCWLHYMETGDKASLEEPYPRLLKFARYLQSIIRDDGLLPVENIGTPAVWLDHNAYSRQRHKKCAFNLYFAGMLKHALAPIARLFGDGSYASQFEELSSDILATTVRTFWDAGSKTFVVNLPWLREEGAPRYCDRSLAEAVLYDFCPNNQTAAVERLLADAPKEMGFSYPCNAGWRYQALGKLGRTDVILSDLRTRWATMKSVLWNNALQEDWDAKPDSASQWSHCPLAPLFILMSEIVGLRATSPGFATYSVKPQLADIGKLDVTLHTPQGALRFVADPTVKGHDITLTLPGSGQGEWISGGTRKPMRAGQIERFSVGR